MTRTQLLWRCRRGMRELDLLLQRYLDHGYGSADREEQAVFHRLLDQTDDQLWLYFRGAATPEQADLADLVEKIRRAAASRS